MNFLESVKMASKTLVANKMRSSLTMLGIIIGNASVIATIGMGEGAQNFVGQQVESLGTNLLFIVPGSPKAQTRPVSPPQTLVLADAEAIASQVPSIKAVAPQITGMQRITYGNANQSTTVAGVTPEFLTVRSFDVAQGRFITELDLRRNEQVVALGADVAETLFGNTDPIGQQIRIRNLSFSVIGVMQAKGSTFGQNQDDVVLVPLTTMANRITGNSSPYGTRINFISVSVENEESMNAAQFQIENLLRLRHQIIDEDDFTVRNQKDLQATMGAITGALTLLLAAIASISLFVGGIGIMNIMLVSVTERTKEIGLRKAIGASQQDILMQFVIEAVILSVAGGLVGVFVGVGGIFMIGSLTPFDAGISTGAIALATGVSGATGLFFGVIPAKKAAKLDPIVALRGA
ncbi:ABC transporter permease [Phormidium pseudopriestleyi FRX01]|uniref:ABC transporter permease n=1 Tax=Phormidium pseudopriestleyi FRX01 TaxID=1759528 RepID=A0ABS3FW21_9CYAN|nr:ABC transporter permease [Phormidium pseudopriestleyi]MBO0351062.1 ABC transporter permease [Phormidium pseudopriestleyi FRX01]